MSWAGIFLMKHHVFVNTVNDNVLISLGFRTCAALGIKMMRHECNGSVFLTVDKHPQSNYPNWMFNHVLPAIDDATERGWMHLPVEILHPYEIPKVLRQDHGVVLAVTGAPQSLIPAAVKAGIYLTLDHLRKLHGRYRFELPKSGSGKHGRLIKKDWANAFVGFLFPDAPDSEKAEMSRAIVGRDSNHLQKSKVSAHCREILHAFNGLDKEDQHIFSDLVAVAKDEQLLIDRREQNARQQDSRGEKQHETPKLLRNLIPPTPACRISRHPQLKRYQCFYTGKDLETGEARTWSRASYWHGKKQGLTEYAALQTVIDWGRRVHRKMQPDETAAEPSEYDVRSVVEKFTTETGFVKSQPDMTPAKEVKGTSSKKSEAPMAAEEESQPSKKLKTSKEPAEKVPKASEDSGKKHKKKEAMPKASKSSGSKVAKPHVKK
ncbi:unnamed protein product [Durusdinium trenchii]|uniref:Uncharacterized protein n=2 Tax=Durusdinium trenchii TaxID=1381693 RepID=A0ABP0KMN2_9DINO|eukprot:g18918.t1